MARILIIDDDEDYAQSIRDLLEDCGHEVHAATNGTAGLELARQTRPDVIILDVMMASDTEGFEVARKIPLSPELKSSRVMLVTGIRRNHNWPFPLEPDRTWLPVDRILEKPILPERLLAELKKLLKDRKD